MLPPWLRSLRRRLMPAPHHHTLRRPAPARARLSAEPLEDRLAPSVSVFQQGVDNGGGTYTGTKDTYVRQDGNNATANRATAATILVDWPDAGNNNDTQGLLRFDNIVGTNPGQVPPNAKIISATLTVTTTNPGDGGEFHRMLVDWADTVTWNTATANGTPGLQADGVEAATAFESSAGIGTLDQDVLAGTSDIDVTRDLQAWANGAANHGWAILPWNNGTDGWEFNQSENTTASNRPRLTVNWVPAATTSATFQQGLNGYTGAHDTWLQENAADANNATTPMVFVDQSDAGASNQNQVLLRFDNIFGSGTGQIPLGSTIIGATLRFETSGGNAQGDGGHFNRMLVPWTDTASWNSMVNGIQANDVEAVANYDSFAGNPSLNPNYTNWAPPVDVTADLQAWSNGLANNGWAMIPWIGGTDGWGIQTSDNPNVASRPQLTVFYGPPPPAPPPATTLDIDAAAQLTMTAGSTTPNNSVTLSLTGGAYTITDTAAPITLTAAAQAAGWTGSGTNTVTGPDASVSGLTIDLNQGNDAFTLRGVNDPLIVTAGGQGSDTLALPVSLTYAGSVSLTGFNTATQTAGTTLTIGTLTIGANTIGSAATNLRTTAGTVNLLGGAGGVFETETDGANVSFKATGSGAVQITNLAGTLTVAGTSFGGAAPVTLTSPDAIAVNASITTNGPVTITANTDGTGNQGFSSGTQGTIVAGDSSAGAFSLTVNTAGGGTGNAVFGAGVATAPGGTITVAANGGNITETGGNAAGTAGPVLSAGAGGDSSSVVLSGVGIGTATSLVRTSTGHIRGRGGNGGVFISEISDSPGTAQATATGAGNVRLVAASATNNGMIIDGPVWTQTGNISLEADDDLILQAPVGGIDPNGSGQTFSGTVTCLASQDLVNEQLFNMDENPALGHSGTITTTNATANAVLVRVSATTTGAGVGGGALLGHITVGNGGTITIDAEFSATNPKRADRAGRILMNDPGAGGGLLDAGPNGTVVLLAKDNSIGQAPFLSSDTPKPILVTAGTVVAATNSLDPTTSPAPLQLPGSIYITTTGPASFQAVTTSAPGYTLANGYPTGTNADIVLTTLSGALTVNGPTRTDSGTINLNGANGIVLNGAIGGAGESGVIILNPNGGSITQPGGSVVTTGGLLFTNTASATLGQAANDLATVAGTVTGALSLADANSVSTGTVTPPAPAFDAGFSPATGITAGGTTVTGGKLNVISGANVTGPATAAAGGTLGGTGTVTGALTASGTVAPGTTGPGTLTVTGATFNAGSTFAVDLNGATAGTQYDQLKVNGTVNLGGATLSGTLGSGFSPAEGTAFTLIDNDGTDAVTGTFAGLAQGATVTIGGLPFTVSYTGGTGNDVVLTRAAAVPVTVTSVAINNGAAQRSMVTSLTVTFSGPVTFASTPGAAFTLTRTGGGAVGFTATASVVGGVTVVTLNAFTGTEANAGSLNDGKYTLTVLASQVAGSGLDGNGDGTAGDNYVLADSGAAGGLYRLYGDINGDRRVDNADFFLLKQTFLRSTGDPLFLSGLDYDNSGTVDNADFFQFKLRFGQSI